jgi:Zn-dependent protease with chaperone function
VSLSGLWQILLPGGLIVAIVTGVGLVVARILQRPGSRTVDTLIFALATLLTTSITVLVFFAGLVAFAQAYPRSPVWILGGWLGLGVFFVRWALNGAVYLYRWTTRRPLELYARAFLIREVVVEMLGFTAVGMFVLTVVTQFQAAGRWLFLLVPFAVALYPLFDYLIKPWFLFARSNWKARTKWSDEAIEIEYWLTDAAAAAGQGRVRLVLLLGDVVDAFAVSAFPPGKWIALGEGLVKQMDRQTLIAVVAHELAHVIRHDVLKLIGVAIISGTGYAFLLLKIFVLLDRGHVVVGIAFALAGGGVLLGLFPGWLSRKIEFGTDRTAARLLDDPETLCTALLRLSELKKEPPDRESLTHPSVKRRIRAIRAFST